jgi:CRISPR-associated protein Cas1
MANKVKSGDTTNVKGVAAAYYWKKFSGGHVRDRNSADSLNRALNYGYTVLRGHAIRSICAAGLHPGIGVFHRGVGNPFSLADDLIEPFRPVMDAVVLYLGRGLDIDDRDTRHALVSAGEILMGPGRKSISSEMTLTAQSIGAAMETRNMIVNVSTWNGIIV